MIVLPGGGGEKTEKASPKKKEDERKKGNIFMSKDITTVVSLVVSFYVMSMFVRPFVERMQLGYMQLLQRASITETLFTADVMNIYMDACVMIATTVLPALIIMGMVVFLTVGVQTRFLFSREQIKFKMERIDPLKGIKRLFSLRSLIELLKSLIKITVLIYILYGSVQEDIAAVPIMFDWEIAQAAGYAGDRILSMVTAVGIAFGGIAGLDFLYQRWEYERNIKMSKQEVKDEYKQMEGNPEIKSARRQKQREFAQNRMMQQVQDSDVIVRNPTHYAVALKYDFDNDPAPIVLAKGQDLIALKIVEEGEKHSISTVENKALARGLYETADINDVIPAEFFQPVAEILAWLYSTKEKDKFNQ